MKSVLRPAPPSMQASAVELNGVKHFAASNT